jgi:O-acetyl-ADP-ribose deacetylase (regulator of RNase III)
VGARSVAFPAVATGIYGYPKDDAASIAVRTVLDALGAGAPVDVVQLVAFSEDDFERYERLLAAAS